MKSQSRSINYALEEWMNNLKNDPRVIGKWVDIDMNGYLIEDVGGISMHASPIPYEVDELSKPVRVWNGSRMYPKKLTTKFVKNLLKIKS